MVIAAASVSAQSITTIEAKVFAIVAALPDGLTGLFEVLYRLGPIVAGGLVVSALVARRPRLLFTLLIAFAVGLGVAALLSGLVDITEALKDAGTDLAGRNPDFPVVPLAAAIAVLLAARPYLTRPTRRMVEVVFWLSAVAAVYLAEGPAGVGAGQPGPVVGGRRRRPLRPRLARGDARHPPGGRLPA